jgi:hypothetical protein
MMVAVASVVADRIYSDKQRAAIAIAYVELSAREVSERAKAGQLLDADGRQLAPFDLPPATVRSIAARARKHGVAGAHGLADVPSSEVLYRKLAAKVDRQIRNGETGPAAAALKDLPVLEERIAKARASAPDKKRGELAGSILAAHRQGGPSPPPKPLPEPEPKAKPPPPPPPPTPGEWMRAELGRMACEQSTPPPARATSGGGVDDSDVIRDERGHEAFGLWSQDYRKGRIKGGVDYSARAFGFGR